VTLSSNCTRTRVNLESVIRPNEFIMTTRRILKARVHTRVYRVLLISSSGAPVGITARFTRQLRLIRKNGHYAYADRDDYLETSMLETISRQSMGIYPNQFISRSNLSSTRSGLGECLTDKPRSPPEKLKYPNMLPGAMYDAEAQCRMEFPDSKVCQQSSVKFSRISRTADLASRSNLGNLAGLMKRSDVRVESLDARSPPRAYRACRSTGDARQPLLIARPDELHARLSLALPVAATADARVPNKSSVGAARAFVSVGVSRRSRAAPFNKATVRYRPEIARTLAPRPLETLIRYQIRATPATAAAHRDCYVSDVRLRSSVVFDQRELPLQGNA